MSKIKIPIALKNPDKIILHYGTVQIELDMSTDFSNYIITIDEDKFDALKPYMANGESV